MCVFCCVRFCDGNSNEGRGIIELVRVLPNLRLCEENNDNNNVFESGYIAYTKYTNKKRGNNRRRI